MFRPERWLERTESGEEKKATPGSYFPFSYGPRKCMGRHTSSFVRDREHMLICIVIIGEGLAMLEMLLTLSTLFKRYDLSFQPGFEMIFQPSFTLCSRNGLPVYARLREC